MNPSEGVSTPGSSALVLATCASVLDASRPSGLHWLSLARVVQDTYGELLYSSEQISARLHREFLVLGEGPPQSAVRTRGPVLVPDIRTTSATPLLAQWCERTGVVALMAFPVQLGAVHLGVLTLSGPAPAQLSDGTLRAVVRGTRVIAEALIGADAAEDEGIRLSPGSARLHQAAGMVMVQLGCSISDALVSLRAHAFATGRPLQDLAEDAPTTLTAGLVYVADTLISGADVADLADRLLRTSLNLLPVVSAGILLDDQQGELHPLASSSESARALELLELQKLEGPCLEAFRSGRLVQAVPLTDRADDWPHFVPAALRSGVQAAYALPMHIGGRPIGAVNLFCAGVEPLSEDDLEAAHALATMASIAIASFWTIRRQETLAEQLQTALNTRLIIEQAKGIVSEREDVDMGQAFELLRARARFTRRPLADVATDVAQGRITRLGEESGSAHATSGDDA